MSATETAIMKAARDRRDDWSWRWLLDRLRDYVTIRGMRPEDEEQLKGLYVDPVFHLDPRGEVGPDVDIMTTFRENASLWLQACPAGEHVVTVPRDLLKAVLECLPPNSDLATMQFDVMDDMGKLLLSRGADAHKWKREDDERTDGERLKRKMDEWLNIAMSQPPILSDNVHGEQK